jgi:hypothetical protein
MHTHLAEVVEASLGDEREEHDERADRRDDPRRCELQRRRLALGRHRPSAPLGSGLPSPHTESVEIKGSRRVSHVNRLAAPGRKRSGAAGLVARGGGNGRSGATLEAEN